MIFKLFSTKNLAKKSAFFTQTKGNFAEKVIITLVFEKNANFFAENWENLAENCHHNIGPWYAEK
jgi:hypothetical protein